MPTVLLHLLNVFFLAAHTGLVLFNVFGWIWPRTRRANLATLLLTLFSWTIMGLWHGVGYCVLTDWHWQVREALGYRDDAGNYVSFLIQTLTPLKIDEGLVRSLSAVVFILSFVMSAGLNLRDMRRGGSLPAAPLAP
jgi:hypothetical protein